MRLLFLNPFNGQPVVIVVGQTTTEITDVSAYLRLCIVIAMVAIIILAGIGGLFLAERASETSAAELPKTAAKYRRPAT